MRPGVKGFLLQPGSPVLAATACIKQRSSPFYLSNNSKGYTDEGPILSLMGVCVPPRLLPSRLLSTFLWKMNLERSGLKRYWVEPWNWGMKKQKCAGQQRSVGLELFGDLRLAQKGSPIQTGALLSCLLLTYLFIVSTKYWLI